MAAGFGEEVRISGGGRKKDLEVLSSKRAKKKGELRG